MIIGTVLSSFTNDEKYYCFVPLFIATWKKLIQEVNIKLICIGKTPSALDKYKDHIVEYENVLNIKNSFISQVIRVLWPSFLDNEKNGILVTDIDMIPTKQNFYKSFLEPINDDKFVHFCPKKTYKKGQMITMCYNVASRETWNKLFKFDSIEEALIALSNKQMIDGKHGGQGWYIDQDYLTHCVNTYINETDIVVCLNWLERLDWNMHNYNKEKFVELYNKEHFTDCHFYACQNKWKLNDYENFANII